MIEININKQINIKTFLFPDKQPHVKISNLENFKEGDDVSVTCSILNTDLLLQLLECSNALDGLFLNKKELYIPYLMGARFDRKMENGDSVDLKVISDLINLCNFQKVYLLDVHSDIATVLIKNSINISNKFLVKTYTKENSVLICPDAGVAATEHSVMCSGSKDDELGTFKRLITEVYPEGIVSIVSDTWDLWKVCSEYLPALKEIILSRNGKVVIRPDSGDPVDIICGNPNGKNIYEQKGVVELLWDVFGGIVNDKGYKVLDQHIGAIYGDSITRERATQICERLKQKGFASQVVFGIGSYTYQYNTRDTFGIAMKATYVEVNGEGREIFKKPITDDGTKISATGLLCVIKENGEYKLLDKVTWEQEKSEENQLKTVFKDGKLIKEYSMAEVRENAKNNL